MREGQVMVKDGKTVIVKNDKLLPMDLDMTMSNGTRVTTKSDVMRPDGATHQMTDGEIIYRSGEMSNINDKADLDDHKDDITRMVE